MKKIGKINAMAIFIIMFCAVQIINIRFPKEIKTVTSNGIVANVKEVLADKNGCIIKIDLRKEDNTAFSQGDRIGEDKISSNKGSLSWGRDIELSPDKRVLTYCYTVYPGKNSELKQLKIEIDSLIHVVEGKKTLEKSIYDLYEEYPLEYDYEQELPMITYKEYDSEEDDVEKEEIEVENEEKGYVPLEEIDGFSIMGVGFSNHYDKEVSGTREKMLHIRTRLRGAYTGCNDTAEIDYLYNELTGEKVEWIQGMATSEGDDTQISEDYYELTHTEKLKSIKPVVKYTKKEVINSGKWTLQVNVKDNVKSLSKETDIEISVSEIPIKLNEIYISTIGAEIQGTVLEEDKLIKLRGKDVPFILYMKDGSEIKLQSTSWSDEVAYTQEYEVEDYIELDEIVKVKSRSNN